MLKLYIYFHIQSIETPWIWSRKNWNI